MSVTLKLHNKKFYRTSKYEWHFHTQYKSKIVNEENRERRDENEIWVKITTRTQWCENKNLLFANWITNTQLNFRQRISIKMICESETIDMHICRDYFNSERRKLISKLKVRTRDNLRWSSRWVFIAFKYT